MTIKEALKSMINFAITDVRIDKALIDAELDGNAAYTKSDEKAVDLATADVLLTLMTTADITEDDVSVNLPEREYLQKVKQELIDKWPAVAQNRQ